MSSFEEWWNGPDRTPKGTMYEYEVCRDTWNARQPEIDALTSRLQRAGKVIENLRKTNKELERLLGAGILPDLATRKLEARYYTDRAALAAYDKEESPV